MSLHCRRCHVWIPDTKEYCPQCGACANCNLLATESAPPYAAMAFCPSCGTGLRLKRPRQGLVRWLWLLWRGVAHLVLWPTAIFSGMAALCIVFDIRSFADVLAASVFGVICGLSVWAIVALARQRP